MESKDFTLTLVTEKDPQKVFRSVLDVRGWWSGYYSEEITGETEKLNDEFTFRAGGDVHFTKHRLTEVVPNEKVVWLTTECNLNFIEKRDEWLGTKIIFEISEKDGKTQLVFTHEGLTNDIECFDSCAPAWTQYLENKLLPLINTD